LSLHHPCPSAHQWTGPMNDTTLLRIQAVMAERGRGRASTYNDVKAGLLTDPVRVGANAVGWPAGEIRALNQARIAGKTDDELRELVRQLHEARKVLA
jgi:prophage regulatory protein